MAITMAKRLLSSNAVKTMRPLPSDMPLRESSWAKCSTMPSACWGKRRLAAKLSRTMPANAQPAVKTVLPNS